MEGIQITKKVMCEKDQIEECGQDCKLLWSFKNRKIDMTKGGAPKILNKGGKLLAKAREITETHRIQK